jgi:2-Cys peroxiredoxin 5
VTPTAYNPQAWKESLIPKDDKTFRFLADSTSAFTKALDLTFDATAVFGGIRSKRYAIYLKDGKVSKLFVEPDNTGVSGS